MSNAIWQNIFFYFLIIFVSKCKMSNAIWQYIFFYFLIIFIVKFKMSNAIWQYIQTLFMLGTTITSIPPETLSMIENVAKQCADKMENDGDELDETQLMKSMQGLLGGMLKK